MKCSLSIYQSGEDCAEQFSAILGLDSRKPPNLQPQILFCLNLADPGQLPRRTRHSQQVQNTTAGNKVSLLLLLFTHYRIPPLQSYCETAEMSKQF